MTSAGETEVQRRFKSEPLGDAPLVAGVVPGVGEASVKKLAEKGVRSAQQLMGRFLLLNRDGDAMDAFLEGAGLSARWATMTREALADKSLEFCTDDLALLPGASPARGGDGVTTTVAEAFAHSALSTRKLVKSQVPGLGEVGIRKVEAKIRELMQGGTAHAQTPTAVQLLGLFLALGRAAPELKRFLEEDCGCRPQDADRTVAALEAKAQRICDVPSGGTPAAKRGGSRLEPTPEGREQGLGEPPAAIPLDLESEIVSTRSSLGFLLLLGALVAALAVYAKMAGYV